MPIAYCTLEIYLPYAQSLKEKRMVLRKAQDRLRARSNFSIAEVDYQDLWQRARLTAALTSGSLSALSSAADGIERWLDARCPDGARVQRVIASVEDLQG